MRAVAVDLGGVVFLPPTDDDPWSWLGRRLDLAPNAVRAGIWHPADIEAANIGQLSAEAYAERAAARLGVAPALVLDAVATLYAGRLNSPLVDYLRGIAGRVKVAALTNNWTFLDQLLARHDVGDLFALVINSADVGCRKPGAEIFTILLDRIGCLPHEVVFVDDDRANVEAAGALGLRTIHFGSTELALAELRNLLG